jgi:hypothetical protein
VSLRIGFKEAFARDQEKDFYEILAAQQVFVFPPLRDEKQQVSVSQGWIEQWWRQSIIRKIYYQVLGELLQPVSTLRGWTLARLNIEETSSNSTYADPSDSANQWQANRNMFLRIVPKILSLLPFTIYLFQFLNDIYSLHYGNELSSFRTKTLVILSSFFLLNTFILGIWCITKWNELDRLWDYYDKHIMEGRKLGEPIYDKKNSVAENQNDFG